METIQLIIGIFFIYLLGFSIFRLLNLNLNQFEKIGMSFGLGLLLLVLQLLISYAFLKNLNINIIIVFWLPIIIYSFLYKRINVGIFKINKFTSIQIILLILILANIVYVFIESQIRPLLGWDALANWFMLSKVFYLDNLISSSQFLYLNIENPIFSSMIHQYIYKIVGGISESRAFFIYPVILLNQLLIIYGCLRRYTNKDTALIFVFLYSTIPMVLLQSGGVMLGYSDLMLGYFILISFVCILEYLVTKNIIYIILVSVFASSATLIKNEGLVIFVVSITIIFFVNYNNKSLKRLLYLVPGFVIFATWQIYKSIYVPVEYLKIWFIDPFKFVEVYRHFITNEVFNLRRWNLFLIGFMLVIFIKADHVFSRMIYISLVLMIIYLSSFIITPFEINAHLSSYADRLLLQLSGIFILIIGVGYYNLLNYED